MEDKCVKCFPVPILGVREKFLKMQDKVVGTGNRPVWTSPGYSGVAFTAEHVYCCRASGGYHFSLSVIVYRSFEHFTKSILTYTLNQSPII